MQEISAHGFSLHDEPLDVAALRAPLAHAQAGAYTSFEGWVRNHHQDRAVAGLFYEAYAALARAEGDKVLAEARARYEVIDIRCAHRLGELAIGDLAVWVGVTAAHRDAAFAACRYVIDEIKSRVPIWKHERYVEGDAGWLHPSG